MPGKADDWREDGWYSRYRHEPQENCFSDRKDIENLGENNYKREKEKRNNHWDVFLESDIEGCNVIPTFIPYKWAAVTQTLLQEKGEESLPKEILIYLFCILTPLVDLVSPTSLFIFHKLDIRGRFLDLLACKCEITREFQRFDRYACTVNMNSIAEPEIQLCSDEIQDLETEENFLSYSQ